MSLPALTKGNSAAMANEFTRCYELRLQGHSIRAIAEITGLSKTTVDRRLTEHIAATVHPRANELRALELDRLDQLWRRAWAVLEADHPYVSGGQVVTHDGEMLQDHAPALHAIDRLLRISERRAKLLGLDLPTQVVVQPAPEPENIELRGLIQAAKTRMEATERALRAGREPGVINEVDEPAPATDELAP